MESFFATRLEKYQNYRPKIIEKIKLDYSEEKYLSLTDEEKCLLINYFSSEYFSANYKTLNTDRKKHHIDWLLEKYRECFNEGGKYKITKGNFINHINNFLISISNTEQIFLFATDQKDFKDSENRILTERYCTYKAKYSNFLENLDLSKQDTGEKLNIVLNQLLNEIWEEQRISSFNKHAQQIQEMKDDKYINFIKTMHMLNRYESIKNNFEIVLADKLDKIDEIQKNYIILYLMNIFNKSNESVVYIDNEGNDEIIKQLNTLYETLIDNAIESKHNGPYSDTPYNFVSTIKTKMLDNVKAEKTISNHSEYMTFKNDLIKILGNEEAYDHFPYMKKYIAFKFWDYLNTSVSDKQEDDLEYKSKYLETFINSHLFTSLLMSKDTADVDMKFNGNFPNMSKYLQENKEILKSIDNYLSYDLFDQYALVQLINSNYLIINHISKTDEDKKLIINDIIVSSYKESSSGAMMEDSINKQLTEQCIEYYKINKPNIYKTLQEQEDFAEKPNTYKCLFMLLLDDFQSEKMSEENVHQIVDNFINSDYKDFSGKVKHYKDLKNINDLYVILKRSYKNFEKKSIKLPKTIKKSKEEEIKITLKKINNIDDLQVLKDSYPEITKIVSKYDDLSKIEQYILIKYFSTFNIEFLSKNEDFVKANVDTCKEFCVENQEYIEYITKNEKELKENDYVSYNLELEELYNKYKDFCIQNLDAESYFFKDRTSFEKRLSASEILDEIPLKDTYIDTESVLFSANDKSKTLNLISQDIKIGEIKIGNTTMNLRPSEEEIQELDSMPKYIVATALCNYTDGLKDKKIIILIPEKFEKKDQLTVRNSDCAVKIVINRNTKSENYGKVEGIEYGINKKTGKEWTSQEIRQVFLVSCTKKHKDLFKTDKEVFLDLILSNPEYYVSKDCSVKIPQFKNDLIRQDIENEAKLCTQSLKDDEDVIMPIGVKIQEEEYHMCVVVATKKHSELNFKIFDPSGVLRLKNKEMVKNIFGNYIYNHLDKKDYILSPDKDIQGELVKKSKLFNNTCTGISTEYINYLIDTKQRAEKLTEKQSKTIQERYVKNISQNGLQYVIVQEYQKKKQAEQEVRMVRLKRSREEGVYSPTHETLIPEPKKTQIQENKENMVDNKTNTIHVSTDYILPSKENKEDMMVRNSDTSNDKQYCIKVDLVNNELKLTFVEYKDEYKKNLLKFCEDNHILLSKRGEGFVYLLNEKAIKTIVDNKIINDDYEFFIYSNGEYLNKDRFIQVEIDKRKTTKTIEEVKVKTSQDVEELKNHTDLKCVSSLKNVDCSNQSTYKKQSQEQRKNVVDELRESLNKKSVKKQDEKYSNSSQFSNSKSDNRGL